MSQAYIDEDNVVIRKYEIDLFKNYNKRHYIFYDFFQLFILGRKFDFLP